MILARTSTETAGLSSRYTSALYMGGAGNYSSDGAMTSHWCPLSQSYAGVDALLGCLEEGWEIMGDVYFEEHWFGESRRICVYHFDLVRHNHYVTMRVVWNPMLDRLLAQLPQKRLSPAFQQVSNEHLATPG